MEKIMKDSGATMLKKDIKTLFRWLCEIFDLDFIGQPQMMERGKIEKIWFRVYPRLDVGLNSWFGVNDMLAISTSKGTQWVYVSKSVCDCMEVGDHIPTKVQISRFFPDRFWLRVFQ